MPADSIHPDQLGGEARFRADLVAYLDSLPVQELADPPERPPRLWGEERDQDRDDR